MRSREDHATAIVREPITIHYRHGNAPALTLEPGALVWLVAHDDHVAQIHYEGQHADAGPATVSSSRLILPLESPIGDEEWQPAD